MIKVDAQLKDELRQFFIIAIPLSAAYLAEFAMFLTTKMVVVVLMAMLSVVGVLAAQALGAGKHHELGQSIRQGLVVATVIGVPAMIAVWNLDLALIATHQDPKVIELARGYLKGISGAVLPVLWFAIFRNFVAVLSQTVSILMITVLAVVLNYLLTLWFVYGGYGVAPLGLFGAGLATTIVSWFMFLALALHVYRKPMFRGFGIFKTRLQLIWPLCREIFTLGTPVAGLAFLEAGLFVATAILSGVIGAKTLAAYEIVMAWVGIPFVIAFGLAEATMIRVAHILIFISPEDPGYAEVSAMASHFLVIAAVFMVFDGLQATAARALRGMKDNLVPLWIAGFGYWVLGIGGGSVLAFHYQMGGAGLWWGLAAGLAVAACLLSWRFHRFTLPRASR
jgi:MATE family multidrug resistance protein